MSSFNPRNLLEKHGWTEGSGLGRNEHGMKEAIKVNIKADTAGVGHDAGAQYKFHWWDHVYNSAAESITVVNDEDGVKVSKLGDYELSVKKKNSKLANRNLLYGCFVKSATLHNDGQLHKESKSCSDSSDSDDETDEDDDKGTVSKITDDELFKKLGGLTAHKAARHGHRLNGKLERLKQQEALNKTTAVIATVVTVNSDETTQEEPVQEKSSKKNKRNKTDDIPPVDEETHRKKKKSTELLETEEKSTELPETSEQVQSKTKSKKRKHTADHLVQNEPSLIDLTCDVESNETSKKKKKKSRNCEDVSEKSDDVNIKVKTQNNVEVIDVDSVMEEKVGKRKKEKKRDVEVEKELRICEEKETQMVSIDSVGEESNEKKKKKKKSNKKEIVEINETCDTTNNAENLRCEKKSNTTELIEINDSLDMNNSIDLTNGKKKKKSKKQKS